MARSANFINDYGKVKPDQRVRMIFLNYQAFPDIILGYEQKIIIRIMDELRGNNGIKLVIPIIPLTEKRMRITECVKNKMEFY